MIRKVKDRFLRSFLIYILVINCLVGCTESKQLNCDDMILTGRVLDFSIRVKAEYEHGSVGGRVEIVNNSESIYNVNGKFPLELGVSICDENGDVVNLDYSRLLFDCNELIKDETYIIDFFFEGLEEEYNLNHGLAFDIVQEGVAWNSKKEVILLRDIVSEEDSWSKRLYTPTQIVKIDDVYFIEDCWHHRIIYSNDMNLSIEKWKVLKANIMGGHTIVNCGDFIVADSTDDDQLLVFSKKKNYQLVQTIEIDKYIPQSIVYGNADNKLSRPHYVFYDTKVNKIYVALGWAGSVISFTKKDGSLHYDQFYYIEDAYIKFLNFFDNHFYMVTDKEILEGNFNDSYFEIRNKYKLPDEIKNLGVNYIAKIKNMYYISTWSNGGLYACESLGDLWDGEYYNIGEKIGIKGIPYYITYFDDYYWITDIVDNSGIIKLNIDAEGIIVSADYIFDFGPAILSDIVRKKVDPIL